ncbi:thermonuclease family protein [Sphingosinicella xenopeptidilytica]|uniref:Thermonuclease family protein n=1 Tax=Sphingosinicella xenopeptidilytica TaxID=364098 RepID=A0ABW3C7F5_SPHXN
MLFMILAAAVFVVPEAEIFACTPVQVWDADGPIWCAEGPRIRLHGIAAREMDGTCRHGHPCPDMPPIAARDVLIKLLQPAASGATSTGHLRLVEASPIACRSHGGAGGNRTAARCSLPDKSDLGCRLIALGAAREWTRFSKGAYRRCAR